MLELLRPKEQRRSSSWPGSERPAAAPDIPGRCSSLPLLPFVLRLRLLQDRRRLAAAPIAPGFGRRGFGYPPVIVVPGGFGGGREGGSCGGCGGFSGGGGSSGGGGASGSW